MNPDNGTKIAYRVATRKLPRGKWSHGHKKKTFDSTDWDAFLVYLAAEYGPDADIQEEPVPNLVGRPQQERRFIIHPSVLVRPNVIIEILAWLQPEEPLHLVTINVLAPAASPKAAGNEVYNRLQDAGFDEERWGFMVTSAGDLDGTRQRLWGLDSGEEAQVNTLLELAHD
jgi:hypothetical protein